MKFLPNIKFFEKNKNKYKLTDFLKRNNISSEIMHNLAKQIDSSINIPKEVGNNLEEVCDFDRNCICIHRIKTQEPETVTNEVFDSGIAISDDEKDITSYVVKYGYKNIWVLFEDLAKLNEDELAFLIKVPNRDINEIFTIINGEMKVSPQRIYGALSIKNGKVNLIKNDISQKETVENPIR